MGADLRLRDKEAGPADVEQAVKTVREAMTGTKLDSGKLPLELLPPELLFRLARVLQFGAKKYAPRNWENGMDWGRLFGAMMRHLWAWWGGEENDPETGLCHLDHAACCIAFLIAYDEREIGFDDRPTTVVG